MNHRLFSLFALLLLTTIAAPMTAGAKKNSHNTFYLNVHFVIGSADGKTNYHKIKGLLGKPNCKAESDCETGHCCWKGVAGVGRNQCRAKRGHKKACTKDKHCTSNRCVLFKCAKPKKKTKKRKKKSSGRLGK